MTLRSCLGEYQKEGTDAVIVDLQFYSQDYLSLLILNKQTHASSLVQAPLHDLLAFGYQEDTVALASILGASWPKSFQGISARRLAVSGARKVAAILSENNRKIRLLETEAEPEDEEEEEEEEQQQQQQGRLSDSMMDTTPSSHFSAETSGSNLQEYYYRENS